MLKQYTVKFQFFLKTKFVKMFFLFLKVTCAFVKIVKNNVYLFHLSKVSN